MLIEKTAFVVHGGVFRQPWAAREEWAKQLAEEQTTPWYDAAAVEIEELEREQAREDWNPKSPEGKTSKSRLRRLQKQV